MMIHTDNPGAEIPTGLHGLGLGDTPPPCSTVVVPPGFVGPINCTPDGPGGQTTQPPPGAATQTQVGNVALDVQDLRGDVEALAARKPDNTLVYVVGALAALALVVGVRK